MSHPDRDRSFRERVTRLAEAADREDAQLASELLAGLHPSQIADVLEASPEDRRAFLWRLTNVEHKGEILTEVHDDVRDWLIRRSRPQDLAAAAGRLQLDELADISGRLPKPVLKAVIQAMDLQRRERFEGVRAWPEESAGGLMDADALSVRADVTLYVVQRYLRRYRRRAGEMPEHTDSLMVVDSANRYLGVLPLADVVARPQSTTVAEVMNREVEGIEAFTPARRVARLFEDHDWLSAPVVDAEGQLIGRITVDDVVDVIREEADRTIMSRAGLDEDMDMFAPVMTSAMRRSVWLGVNLANAFIAAWVIGLFEASIAQRVALAVLMPVVASMGGVAGTQSLTLVTRGIALDQVTRANSRRLLATELGVGLVNGLFWAVVVAAIATAWFEDLKLGLVFGLAMVINIGNGTLTGTLIPLLLRRLGIDPALAGGVLLVALTDVIGFFAFLGLATLWLLG
ncbi:MAG: magnesium transporter [Chromatiales bacterium]|jgi:magnesium transporter